MPEGVIYMIEVIYKDEKQTAKGNEESFNLPKNIRQIGIPNEKYRIYIEDYVYTFLKKICRGSRRKAPETPPMLVRKETAKAAKGGRRGKRCGCCFYGRNKMEFRYRLSVYQGSSDGRGRGDFGRACRVQ